MFRLIDPPLAVVLKGVEWDGGGVAPLKMGPALYYLPQCVIDRLPADVAALIGEGSGSADDDAELLAAGQSAAISALASARWQRCQLFTYDGEADAYADAAIAVTTAKIRALEETGSTDPINFKLTATAWRSWTLADLKAYGQAIDAHIQACFDNEAAIATQIQAATGRAELNAIDLDAGWPT